MMSSAWTMSRSRLFAEISFPLTLTGVIFSLVLPRFLILCSSQSCLCFVCPCVALPCPAPLTPPELCPCPDVGTAGQVPAFSSEPPELCSTLSSEQGFPHQRHWCCPLGSVLSPEWALFAGQLRLSPDSSQCAFPLGSLVRIRLSRVPLSRPQCHLRGAGTPGTAVFLGHRWSTFLFFHSASPTSVTSGDPSSCLAIILAPKGFRGRVFGCRRPWLGCAEVWPCLCRESSCIP